MSEGVNVRGLAVSLRRRRILHDVSFSVDLGSTIAVLGASGSGKTTLLRAIAGFIEPTAGSVVLGGRSANDMRPEHRGVSMLFQEPALFDDLTVEDNATVGAATRGEREARLERVHRLARSFRINNKLSEKVRHLSGGEKQRAAILRAFANVKPLLLLDEPLKAALNLDLKWALMDAIRAETQSNHLTTVLVTHDFQEAAFLAANVVVLVEGPEPGVHTASRAESPELLYGSPPSQQIARLLGPVNELPAADFLDGGRREMLYPVQIAGGDLGHPRGAVSVLFRPSSVRLLLGGTGFRVKSCTFLGDSYRVLLCSTGTPQPGFLEASVSPALAPSVNSTVGVEIPYTAISVFNGVGEKIPR